MFLDYLKGFSVKKIVKNSLLNVKNGLFLSDIKTVGLIIDESYFKDTQSLINEIVLNGIAKENIELLLFKSKVSVDFGIKTIKLESSHLNWKAQITNKEVIEFLEKDFDLLVNYYDVEKAILLVVTHQSNAKFKVGFSSIDKRLNNLMIATNLGNYKVFVEELFRYLKILNKK
ncbi:hypothetical protein SAMN05192550_2131 [Flavobacterium glycines]|uniref:Uncharacterized protein n=1 Tax=Flavobacterium glycines TaxID=551990 RepID=A0A1B9DZ49_9FLAO|nr:hypothetical protein [Flavobacterium glycines]OCB74959.1 hypothetical protein FBGL_00355 [Flavobacterium glycines]GEL11244.1 hypothetical protein FGL01_19830 [Flavobacterium glycines]SDJ45055.1 hypothetical protein SAMN05192550_2131 [Flavobacterium glycines]